MAEGGAGDADPAPRKKKRKKRHRSAMVEGYGYRCGYCGESCTVFVDPTAASAQSYVEDCQVCCRPNRLDISIDPETGAVTVASTYDG